MKVLIFSNTKKDKGTVVGQLVFEWLKQKGIDCYLINEIELGNRLLSEITNGILYTYLIIIGGDGSILRGIHFNDLDLPILGINMGSVGFLADVEFLNIEKCLSDLISKTIEIKNYTLLEGKTQNTFCDYAFNDIVIGREGFARIITTELYINNEFVNSFRGDGLVISTAHGSTAYNLSLHGPLVHPDSPVFIITPIAPQNTQFNSLVIPDTSKIKVIVKGSLEREALITFDGRENEELLCNMSEVNIMKSVKTSKFIKMKGYSFYGVVRKKL